MNENYYIEKKGMRDFDQLVFSESLFSLLGFKRSIYLKQNYSLH